MNKKKAIKGQQDIQYFHAQFKSIPLEKAISLEAQSVTKGTVISGYASTPTLDRYNDIVEPEAFRKSILENYRKNPIILFQHNPNRPIGKALYMSIDQRGLYIEGLIVDDEIEPKIHAGILQAFSIGYIPKEMEYLDEDGNKLDEDDDILRILFEEGIKRIIKDLDLVENSIVSVPANPDALFTMEKSLKNFFDKDLTHKFFKETENDIIYTGMKDENGEYLKFNKKDWDVEAIKNHLFETYNNNVTQSDMLKSKNLLAEKKEDEEVKPEEVTPAEEKPTEKPDEASEKPEGEAPAEEEAKTPDSETPVNEEGGEKPAEEEAPAEEKPEGEEEVPIEDKPETADEKSVVPAKAFDVAMETIVTQQKKIEDLEKKLAETPAKKAHIFTEHDKLPAKKDAEEQKPEEKTGFKDAFKVSAN